MDIFLSYFGPSFDQATYLLRVIGDTDISRMRYIIWLNNPSIVKTFGVPDLPVANKAGEMGVQEVGGWHTGLICEGAAD